MKSIIVHSGFKWDSYENDIAMFKLVKLVEYNKYIQPICLPHNSHLVTDKNPCYISGWRNRKKKGNYLMFLQIIFHELRKLSYFNSSNLTYYGEQGWSVFKGLRAMLPFSLPRKPVMPSLGRTGLILSPSGQFKGAYGSQEACRKQITPTANIKTPESPFFRLLRLQGDNFL